jgi:hypothetical protein
MLVVQNYKTADEILAAMDTGGSFWDVFSKANDGVLTFGELGHAARLSRSNIAHFLQHILWDLPQDDIERIRKAVPQKLMETIHHKSSASKEPWNTNAEPNYDVQFVTTEGCLKQHQDSTFEEIPVFGADDLSQPLQVKVPDPLEDRLSKLKLFSKPVGKAFWLYQLLQDELSPTPDEEAPLVLSTKKQPMISFSRPVRLTVCWSGLHYPARDAFADRRPQRSDRQHFHTFRDEYNKGFDYLARPDEHGNFNDHEIAEKIEYMHLRVLYCTPLDEAEASQMLSAANQNDQDISSDLLRHSLTHRVK